MNIKSMNNDYVLLIPHEIQKQTSLIVDNSDTQCIGKVVYDYRTTEFEVVYQAGATLIFDISRAQKYTIGSKDYIIVKADNIIAEIEV